VGGLLALLALSGFVDDEGAPLDRGGGGNFQQVFDPAPVYPLVIPPGLGDESLQALRPLTLRSHYRLGVGKSGERLVAFGRQQQPPRGNARKRGVGR
jgi:hypothetical protein